VSSATLDALRAPPTVGYLVTYDGGDPPAPLVNVGCHGMPSGGRCRPYVASASPRVRVLVIGHGLLKLFLSRRPELLSLEAVGLSLVTL